MAVYCYMKDCKHRSKRKSKAKNGNGDSLYRCTLEHIVMSRHVNEDVANGDYEEDALDNMSYCLNYKREPNK